LSVLDCICGLPLRGGGPPQIVLNTALWYGSVIAGEVKHVVEGIQTILKYLVLVGKNRLLRILLNNTFAMPRVLKAAGIDAFRCTVNSSRDKKREGVLRTRKKTRKYKTRKIARQGRHKKRKSQDEENNNTRKILDNKNT